jgi:CubicO group peptidase (beta-lactamase class C family)
MLTTVIGSTFLFAQQLSVTRLDGTKISPSQIDVEVTRMMEAAHVTGVGIAVWNDDKVAYLKTYGERNTEKHLPLTPDSVMTAASLTKPAFAAMVMELVHERVIDLDKPVYEYLPKPLPDYSAYKDLVDDPRYKQITMRMLLDHTSGFPNWRRFTDDKKLRIYFPPGSRFAYSGEGIALAQMVVETVTKKSVTELMNEHIFQPLGMTRTNMVWEERFEDDYARLSYGLGWGLYWTRYGEAFFKEGHDEGWRHYIVCFDRPKAAMLIMTNSSNGEDIYSGLLEQVLLDTFTPLEWEGFKASTGLSQNHP